MYNTAYSRLLKRLVKERNDFRKQKNEWIPEKDQWHMFWVGSIVGLIATCIIAMAIGTIF